MGSAVDWYNDNAPAVCAQYESVDPDELHEWMADLLPDPPASALDVGAGTGRDAAWLASKGFDVVAAEPSAGMRRAASERHPDAQIRWLADSLPGLERTIRLGRPFDLILANAVWMHVRPPDRQRAFRKLINLLNPGGLIAFSVRVGPSDGQRSMHPVEDHEFEILARGHGAYVQRRKSASDQLGRPDVRWIHTAVRLPDESTGALPLLRHMILNDDKSATYKLGLLRSLCRIADGTAGLARQLDDDTVSVPFGMVALTWLRLYKPLLEADCPQSPANRSYGIQLSFAREAFSRIRTVSNLDLRTGMRFSGERALDVHYALRDVANTIRRMPARYLTFQDGAPVFPVEPAKAVRPPGSLLIDDAYLWSFGKMLIPWRLWQAMQRYSAWIEPAIVEEWVRLMQKYAETQGRRLDRERIIPAMNWADPTRDVTLPTRQARRLLASGRLHCVWSGKALSDRNLDLDHCLPWSAWPCGDLWNLMPAHRRVNQREKKAQLPSRQLMRSSQDRIMSWWKAAYGNSTDGLEDRFRLEARTSLPGVDGARPSSDTIFEAVVGQRGWLRQSQRVPEWPGEKYVP